jgi:di/tricarboxylate transporter
VVDGHGKTISSHNPTILSSSPLMWVIYYTCQTLTTISNLVLRNYDDMIELKKKNNWCLWQWILATVSSSASSSWFIVYSAKNIVVDDHWNDWIGSILVRWERMTSSD